MNQFCDHSDLFHWLKTIGSCAINLFSYNSNPNSLLIKILTGFGSTRSLSLDGNMYFVSNNECNPYTS